ncbi:TSUP family transporter [Qipengyuania sp.]|uniref:TSUP family transporter n=1 Tax=Qipengyuania sp. TaxID=2004515 RepID=UPI0035C82C4E
MGGGIEVWIVVAVTAFAAGFVRGLAGFGLSVVLVPVLGNFIAPPLAVLVGNLTLFGVGLTDIGRIRRDADRSALPIALLALLAVPLGLYLVTTLRPDWARFLIALVSLGSFVLVVTPLGPLRMPRWPAMTLSGLATGFFGGFAGMPGPGMAPFYLRGRLSPGAARASMMAIFLVVTPLSSALFIATGTGGWQQVALALALLPVMIAGDWLGHRAYGRVTERQWRLSVFGLLGATALVSLARLAGV